MKGSLDANAVLRLIIGDIPQQAEAVTRLLESTKSGQLAVADVAIIEVVFVMGRVYGLTRARSVELVVDFMGLPQINCNRILFDQAFKLYLKHPALSLEDCCLSIYAQLNRATPLYTFDKKLAKQVSATKLLA